MTLTLLILGISIWLAGMSLAIVLPLKPTAVKITEKLVCPPGTAMQVTTEVYSYHRPGQRAINIFYTDEYGSDHNINGRAILVFLILLFVASLPIVTAAVLIIRNLIQNA